MQYLVQCRLERGAAILKGRPSAGITDTALDCGFSSSQYFATVFAKRFGCSPKEYRRANQTRRRSPAKPALGLQLCSKTFTEKFRTTSASICPTFNYIRSTAPPIAERSTGCASRTAAGDRMTRTKLVLVDLLNVAGGVQLSAQNLGSIVGLVTDPSGAAVSLGASRHNRPGDKFLQNLSDQRDRKLCGLRFAGKYLFDRR